MIRNLTINQKAAVAFPAFPTKFSQFSRGKATAGDGRREGVGGSGAEAELLWARHGRGLPPLSRSACRVDE